MKKRFIVLVDFSRFSAPLMRYVSSWSLEADAEVLLMHQPTPFYPIFITPETRRTITRHTKAEALKKMDLLATSSIDHRVTVKLLAPIKPLWYILNRTLKQPYDSIVVTGLEDAGFLRQLLDPKSPVQVIENTSNLVAAIPGGVDVFNQDRIFVAVSDTFPINRIELDNFFSFMSNPRAVVTFFHLAKPGDDTQRARDILAELAEAYKNRFSTAFEVYEGRQRFSRIRDVINSDIDELLVVQKGSRLLSDKLFRSFVINELVYQGKTPLIILP